MLIWVKLIKYNIYMILSTGKHVNANRQGEDWDKEHPDIHWV